MGVIAQQTAEALISSLVLGAAIAALAWIVLRAMPPGKAGARFLVWFSALGAIAIVPLVQIMLKDRSSDSGWLRAGHSWIVLSSDLASYVLYSWAGLVFIGLARVILGVVHLRYLRSASTLINPAELSLEAQEYIARAAQKRGFELRTSDVVSVPMAIGFWKPAILIPTDLVHELSPTQLSHVLLHEIAHLMRYDDWTNLVQKIAQAVLFFHPAVWLLERELTLQREMACDEAVVAQTSDARSYAESLALLAERSVFKRSLALVQAAVSRLHQTSLRVKALLEKDTRNARVGYTAAGVAGVVVFSAMLVQAPNLVSFQESSLNEQITVVKPQSSWRSQKEPVSTMVVRAAFKQQAERKAERATRFGSAKKTSLSAAAEAPRFQKAVQPEGEVVLASARGERIVPVVVTTEMIVERSGPEMSEQVWGVWQVTIYYTTAERKAAAVPRKT